MRSRLPKNDFSDYVYVNVKTRVWETLVDLELSDEQLAFAQAARDFAQGELAPHAATWDEEGIFPIDAFKRAGQLGFLRNLCERGDWWTRLATTGCHAGV